jgi:probable HAF family extracellular repeat protein
VWQNGTETQIQLPGENWNAGGAAYAINDAGQVTGQASSGRAFVWQNQAGTVIGTFAGAQSAGSAINSLGDVVGWSQTATSQHAFIYKNSTMTDLNALVVNGSGWELQSANGINDAGQIVGSGKQRGECRRLSPHADTEQYNHAEFGWQRRHSHDHVCASGNPTGVSPNANRPSLGQSTVAASSTIVAVYGTANVAQATFNPQGVTPGVYTLVATQPDATSVTVTNGFTVHQGGTAQVYVNVIGRTTISSRTGRTYFIVVGNPGAIDSAAGALWANISMGLLVNGPAGFFRRMNI